MAAFFGALGEFSGTFGSTLNGQVQSDVFYAKTRKYTDRAGSFARRRQHPDHRLHAARRGREPQPADVPPLPRAAQADDGAPGSALLRSLCAARLVGGSQLHGRRSAETRHGRAEAARRRLRHRREARVQRAMDRSLSRTRASASGAYSNGGAYDVHPYMLLNYNGKYNDVSTLAHELGHTMQSYFSNKTQPYPLAGYPIFVAEVASTFNEALLIDHMLKTIKDDAARLSLLGNYLEGIKGTVFRQTQFAEFELRDARDGRKGRAAHRRGARRSCTPTSRRSTTATTRASASSTTTSSTSGRSSRTSTATSTSSSTRRRSPRRRRCRRRSSPAIRRPPSAT